MQSLAIPAAILIGFGFIALAIYFSGRPTLPGEQNALGTDGGEVVAGDPTNITPVTDEDHIRGNPNAPIVLVEYSDYDCPFCKNFHETMKQIMAEYGSTGEVAWVYRHFPLEQLHPSAPKLAEAAECVADLGGNDAFWTFSDMIFEGRDTNAQTDMARLPEFAESAGVDRAAFNECLASGEMAGAVSEDHANAVAIGGRGTPHTIVMIGDQQGVINGAQSITTVRQIIESLLAQMEGVEGGAEAN